MTAPDGLCIGRVRDAVFYDGVQRRPPSTTRDGVGTAAFSFAGDCAICGWRFGTMGEFARCGGREFRPVRGATGALPLDPTIF